MVPQLLIFARYLRSGQYFPLFFYLAEEFLQRVSIACYAERCISYDRFRLSVHLSVCLSHAGIMPKRLKLGSWGCCCCCDSPATRLPTSVVQVEEVCDRRRVVPQVLRCELRRVAWTVEQMLYGVWCHSTLRTNI